jgi:glycine oxidase
MDCLIIGGGLIGMLTARELAQAGLEVGLVERGETGRESSWAGGGILSPLSPWDMPEAVTRLAAWGQRRYPKLAGSLHDETGVDPEWIQSGLLILDPVDAGRARRWAAEHEVRLEDLDDRQAIAAIEPGCRAAESALWLPDAAQVRNPRLVRALARSLELHGVTVRTGTEVCAIAHERGRVRGVATVAGHIEADRVVIAGGAWSAGLLMPLGVDVAIRPVRGQMLLYRAAPGLLTRIVIAQGNYLIPRRDGHVLAGSTLEETGFDKSTTAAARDMLARIAVTLAPALAGAGIVRQWAGLRPGSPSGVPYIGEVPGIDGLFINAGHFRNGVLLAPGSARLLSDILLGRSRIVDASPYALMAVSSPT